VVLVLLLQNLSGASFRVGNGPFRSLALEERLYLLYFPLLWLRRRWGWSVALAAALGCSLVWRSLGLLIWGSAPQSWYVVGPARWFEWALGAIAVEAHFGHLKLPRFFQSSATLLWFSALALASDLPLTWGYQLPAAIVPRDLFFGLTPFVLVNVTCRREREGHLNNGLLPRCFQRVGEWSYSIYLTHSQIIVAVKQAAIRLNAPLLVILALRFGLAILFGSVFHRFIERRFIELARRAAHGGKRLIPRTEVARADP